MGADVGGHPPPIFFRRAHQQAVCAGADARRGSGTGGIRRTPPGIDMMRGPCIGTKRSATDVASLGVGTGGRKMATAREMRRSSRYCWLRRSNSDIFEPDARPSPPPEARGVLIRGAGALGRMVRAGRAGRDVVGSTRGRITRRAGAGARGWLVDGDAGVAGIRVGGMFPPVFGRSEPRSRQGGESRSGFDGLSP